MKIAKIYSAFLWRFLRITFPLWQRLGFHITPNNYYQPIPDTAALKNDLWEKQSELIGVRINDERQVKLLSLFSSRFKKEYEGFPRKKTDVPYQFYLKNGMFESVDAEVLYCMIRHFKPKRIFEIGSGNSTYLSAQAALKNKKDGRECELTAIEPYPNKILRRGFPGFYGLIPTKIEDLPLSEFDKLRENDILFIDSSHALKIGGDVRYEYLEILPRLQRGIIIHFHDIFLPAEYPKEWVVKDCKFWTEQYLLQAFLAFNDKFEVLWAGNYMHLRHPDKIEAAFGSYRRNESQPGSFWIRKTT